MFTKKWIVGLIAISGIIVLIHSKSQAQDVKITTYAEKTIKSPKIGASAGYRFGCNFEVGGFFQQEIKSGYSERPSKSEYEFYGMYFRIPLLCREKFGFDFQVRSGIVNKENFTITPSLHLSYRPVSFLGISAGMGVRNLSPTFMPGIEIIF